MKPTLTPRMKMNFFRLALGIGLTTLLASCGSINRYDGTDAVIIPVPCNVSEIADASGKLYKPYTSLIQVDGSFIGSGHGCLSEYTYSIRPGLRRLTAIANVDHAADPLIRTGRIEFDAPLEPAGRYVLKTAFDGVSLSVMVLSEATSTVVAKGSTQEIKTYGKQNGALMAVPLLIKK
jgi:hypothetical protein